MLNAVTIAAIVAACWVHPQGQAYLAKIETYLSKVEAISAAVERCGNPCCSKKTVTGGWTQEDEDELRRYLRLVEKNAQESAEIKAKALAVPAKQVADTRQEARALTTPVLTLVSKPEHREPFVKLADPDKEIVAQDALNEEAMLIMVMMTEL